MEGQQPYSTQLCSLLKYEAWLVMCGCIKNAMAISENVAENDNDDFSSKEKSKATILEDRIPV